MLQANIAQTNEPLDETKCDNNSSVRLLVLGLTVGGAYYVGALIGFALTFPDDAVSTLWPPNAILLASLLLTPTRTWWVILAGVLPAHFAVQLQTGVPLLMILCWFISNSAEALTGAFCVRYFIPGPLKFDSFHHVGIFTTFAVIFSPFVTSFLDAGFVVLNQWRQVGFWETWQLRFSSNVLAALTLVPAIVLWIRNGVTGLRPASFLRTVEMCALISGLLSSAFLVFSWQNAGPSALPVLVYMPLPFLLWAAMRFGSLVSSTCILIWALLSIWETLHGRGAFIGSSAQENVFFLQLFLIVVSMPLCFLAALLEERRSAEQTRAQAAAIIEFSNDGIIGESLDGIITSWNRGAEKLFDYSAEEVIGRPMTILMPSDDGTIAARNPERVNETIYSDETVRLAKGGRPIHVSVTRSSVIDAQGRKIGVSSIMRDITQRKRVESRLNAQYAVTRVLSESNSIADAAPRILQAICECLGWEFGELWRVDSKTNLMTLFKSWHLPSKDLGEFACESLRFTFAPGIGLPGRVWKSREASWIRNLAEDSNFLRDSLAAKAGLRGAFGFPIVVGNEMLGAMVFFSYDCREADQELLEMMASAGGQMGQFIERKQTEEALRDSEKRLARTEEFSLVMVTHTDLEGRWLKVPPTLCKLLGYTEGELLGRHFQDITHPDDVEANVHQRLRLHRGEIKSFDIEKRYIRKDGGIVWVSLNVSAVTDANENPIHCLSYIRDITERKRAEEDLKEALLEVKRLKEQLEAENVYLRSEVSGAHRYGEIIGESEGIKKIFEQVDRVAPNDMTVLILGETGTGKELVARLVHEKSARRERPLVKVNCSTLPAELIESELFGHERGAFTGAVSKQVGRFELADGGTIFLDEVGEFPSRLQSKLLRVLQEGEFERLGSGKTIKVDVRVIAATNRNLSEAARRGRFRADLYYRLNVYPIEVPPLRDRRGDIGLLSEVFLNEAARRLGKNFGKIPNHMIEELRAYSWPGNVRELENVISRAAVLSTASFQLPEGWNKAPVAGISSTPLKTLPEPFSLRSESPQSVPTLEQFERTRILAVLHQTNWRVGGPKGAAVILGLHPNTLRSRLQKLGVRNPSKVRNSVAESTK